MEGITEDIISMINCKTALTYVCTRLHLNTCCDNIDMTQEVYKHWPKNDLNFLVSTTYMSIIVDNVQYF